VRHISDCVAVMLGHIVETATAATLFQGPGHPYTQMLLDAIPRPDLRRRRVSLPAGEVPSPFAPRRAARFIPAAHARQASVVPRCPSCAFSRGARRPPATMRSRVTVIDGPGAPWRIVDVP
jgi:oligopeptide/dipeptide ABC transporter ATP-binding protein